MHRIPSRLGTVLSFAGAALTSSFQTGSALALEGTEEIDVPVAATFDAASALTSITFQLVISDDGSTWTPIESEDVLLATGTPDAPTTAHVYNASLGNTVRGRLRTSKHRNAKFVAVQAKGTGAATGGGTDAATASLNYDEIL